MVHLHSSLCNSLVPQIYWEISFLQVNTMSKSKAGGKMRKINISCSCQYPTRLCVRRRCAWWTKMWWRTLNTPLNWQLWNDRGLEWLFVGFNDQGEMIGNFVHESCNDMENDVRWVWSEYNLCGIVCCASFDQNRRRRNHSNIAMMLIPEHAVKSQPRTTLIGSWSESFHVSTIKA
jgi:hypothetical protein